MKNDEIGMMRNMTAERVGTEELGTSEWSMESDSQAREWQFESNVRIRLLVLIF